MDTRIVGISTDSVDRLERFGRAEGVPFQLVSDGKGDVARLYDVRRRFGLGTSRVTYIVDREGGTSITTNCSLPDTHVERCNE